MKHSCLSTKLQSVAFTVTTARPSNIKGFTLYVFTALISVLKIHLQAHKYSINFFSLYPEEDYKTMLLPYHMRVIAKENGSNLHSLRNPSDTVVSK